MPQAPCSVRTAGRNICLVIKRLLASAWALASPQEGWPRAYDNAVAELFFATIKRELISTTPCRSVVELRRAVINYIEGRHNTPQLHSSLSCLSPADWEALHRDNVSGGVTDTTNLSVKASNTKALHYSQASPALNYL